MARILFAWELGGAYGHIARMLPLALELRRRGHRPVLALRELIAADRLLGRHGLVWYQAPLWIGRATNLPAPRSHAELLMHFGFLDPQALLSISRTWRHLVDGLAPELIVFDYAPTALLATRGLPVARFNLAQGFFVPPAGAPLPAFQWWKPPPAPQLADAERQVLNVVNQVAYELGAPLLGGLREVLTCPDEVMTTWPELDHYPARKAADYVGPIFDLGSGEPVSWLQPERARPRVFGYLKPDYAGLVHVLDALAASDASVLVHVPGAARRTVERYTSARMRVSAQPFDMDAVARSCDLALLHAGLGSVCAMLLAGKPMLLFPQHTEQEMMARRVRDLGAAIVLSEASAAQMPRLLRRALDDTTLAAAATRFAAAHSGYDQTDTVAALADRCEALLR